MVPPLARTSAEAHLYMDLHPCQCGAGGFARDSAVIALADGDLASRYTGDCGGCGRPREFLFRLPAETMIPAAGRFSYGDTRASELLDPGEWLWVADAYAGTAPADPADLPAEQRVRAGAALHRAAAAVDEVLKFVPAGADEAPTAAVTSERGRSAVGRQPGRLRRNRLVALRDAYAALADRFG
ncbi:hypothetical protein [Plantactinospora sp. KBS50]|uniref:hypothetical protein n=1 Tax=Plantactinospora sp. KBS50 TaxID=2024580 RepID=UPI000BAAC5EC|nr:hypothetical protein [Plantactinospora sp. KBS50]ASW58066.1 hypothetical protein CIK06_27585 [Plantactinospora sp. KBS50]